MDEPRLERGSHVRAPGDVAPGINEMSAAHDAAPTADEIAERIELRDFVGGRGCVVRGGHLVYSWGDIARRADVASAFKPWLVHLLLLLLDQGILKSLDEPAVFWEPRLNPLNSPKRDMKDP